MLSRKPLKDMEALANTAVEKSAHVIGDELYARVYWVALVEVFPSDVAQRIEWNWPKMVASMRTIAERYGAQWNVQQFALFGCMMQDRETTREMLKKSRGNPIPEVWGHSEFFDTCDTWASAATPKAGPKKLKAIFPR